MSLPAFTTPSTLFIRSTTPSTRFIITITKGHQIPLGKVKGPFTEEQNSYSTPFLKALETVTTLTVLLVSSFLLTILLIGTRRFTVPFFKILIIVVTVLVIRSVASIALKLPTLWFGAEIAYQNMITLVADMLSRRFVILLIFLLALNRFSIILYPSLDRLLFARHRYKFMCLICLVISTAETYFVITASKMSREFVEEIGFVDHLDSAKPYEISCLVSLAIALISVLLHLAIILHVRYYHRTKTEATGKVQQRMFREIIAMTVMNTMFTLLFIILYETPTSLESRMFIVSIYNILCFLPDALMPVLVLIGSREVHAEISARFITVRKTKVDASRKPTTSS